MGNNKDYDNSPLSTTASDVSTNDDDNDDNAQNKDDDDDGYNDGSKEAGFVRGVSRSIQSSIRSWVRLPTVGRIPRPRQIAKLTDRVSTGLDIWDSADEAAKGEGTVVSQKTKRIPKQHNNDFRDFYNRYRPRVLPFLASLAKNTLLGAVVFDTYCRVVVLNSSSDNNNNTGEEDEAVTEKMIASSSSSPSFVGEKDNEESHNTNNDKRDDSIDVFSQTPLALHFVAGGMAGCCHSLFSTLWETTATLVRRFRTENNNKRQITTKRVTTTLFATLLPTQKRNFTKSTLHHALAHSLLFGSYEYLKRSFVVPCVAEYSNNDDDTNNDGGTTTNNANNNNNNNSNIKKEDDNYLLQPQQLQQDHDNIIIDRMEYLLGIGIAGGIAGQVQYVASHYSEQWLLPNNNNGKINHSPVATTTTTTTTKRKRTTARTRMARKKWLQFRTRILATTKKATLASPPSLRLFWGAFPPSAITFVALEYGKDFVGPPPGNNDE